MLLQSLLSSDTKNPEFNIGLFFARLSMFYITKFVFFASRYKDRFASKKVDLYTFQSRHAEGSMFNNFFALP